jgi:hypothetical protein
MRKRTVAAILQAVGIFKVTAAPVFQRIQRTVTEKAVKLFLIDAFVAREIFTCFMCDKRKIFTPPGFTFSKFNLILKQVRVHHCLLSKVKEKSKSCGKYATARFSVPKQI